MTFMPPCADTWTMPRPMVPVPTMASVRSRAFASIGMSLFPHAIRACSISAAALTGKVRCAIVRGNSRTSRAVPDCRSRLRQSADHLCVSCCKKKEAMSQTERQITVEEAIRGRKSTRAFLQKPVPHDLIARILETANRAPSGSNIQPWKVWVLDTKVKDELVRELLTLYDASGEGKREYNYYPVNWREPYLARR